MMFLYLLLLFGVGFGFVMNVDDRRKLSAQGRSLFALSIEENQFLLKNLQCTRSIYNNW